jgi:hypothetical protein
MQEMQSKLLTVAQGLEVAFDDGRHEAGDATTETEQSPAADGAATDDATASTGSSFDDNLVDPRYEDLWVSTEAQTVDIPDLATIDIDFDDETRDRD